MNKIDESILGILQGFSGEVVPPELKKSENILFVLKIVGRILHDGLIEAKLTEKGCGFLRQLSTAKIVEENSEVKKAIEEARKEMING